MDRGCESTARGTNAAVVPPEVTVVRGRPGRGAGPGGAGACLHRNHQPPGHNRRRAIPGVFPVQSGGRSGYPPRLSGSGTSLVALGVSAASGAGVQGAAPLCSLGRSSAAAFGCRGGVPASRWMAPSGVPVPSRPGGSSLDMAAPPFAAPILPGNARAQLMLRCSKAFTRIGADRESSHRNSKGSTGKAVQHRYGRAQDGCQQRAQSPPLTKGRRVGTRRKHGTWQCAAATIGDRHPVWVGLSRCRSNPPTQPPFSQLPAAASELGGQPWLS